MEKLSDESNEDTKIQTPLGKSNEDFFLLKSIHDFLCGYKSNNDNILIKYLQNSKIIKDEKNLSLFINELLIQIKKGNTIILPFIDPCFSLVESYIDTDYKEINWGNIFTQLIENSFINRKNLIPIYAYFTELYSIFDNQKKEEEKGDLETAETPQSDDLIYDEKLKDFTKFVKLWKLFYSFSENKTKNSSKLLSSF